MPFLHAADSMVAAFPVDVIVIISPDRVDEVNASGTVSVAFVVGVIVTKFLCAANLVAIIYVF